MHVRNRLLLMQWMGLKIQGSAQNAGDFPILAWLWKLYISITTIQDQLVLQQTSGPEDTGCFTPPPSNCSPYYETVVLKQTEDLCAYSDSSLHTENAFWLPKPTASSRWHHSLEKGHLILQRTGSWGTLLPPPQSYHQLLHPTPPLPK